jgi:2-amino-4-hydroxy-6-hydroxymethyldihydropteridine diphosphokinase
MAAGSDVEHVRRIVVGLGSNVGDRLAHLEAAIARIREDRDLFVLKASPVYETAPEGGPPQGDYLNAAVLLVTSLDGRSILDRLLSFEREMGRERDEATRWGPRTIDLDLLWIEGEAIDEEGLRVPHPRLHERPFALRPLLDVAPDAVDVHTGQAFASLPAATTPLAAVSAPLTRLSNPGPV